MNQTKLYSPLKGDKSTRLLRLQPGQWTDPLSLELIHEELNGKNQSYEATSYTWGSSTDSKTILCNGIPLVIRQSAFQFFRRLRKPHDVRHLWMDCICINQDDLDEKAEQVIMMAQIYREANGVLIWLGEEADDSALGMEYVAKLDSEKYLQEFNADLYRVTGFRQKSFLFDDLPETEDNKRLAKALFALLRRPWTRRIWVQQEAAVCANTTVICGSHEVSWNHFLALAWLLKPRTSLEWPDWVDCPVTSIEASLIAVGIIQSHRIKRLRIYSPYSTGVVAAPVFCKIMADSSWCEATDARDKVYGLYGLASGEHSEMGALPPVDYRVPWQIVFTRFAKWMYGNKWQDTISGAGRWRQKDPNIPSWVPDWRHAIDIVFIPHAFWSAGGGAYLPNPRFLGLPRAKSGANPLPLYTYIDDRGRRRRIPNMGMELTCILLDRVVYKSPKLSPEDKVSERQEIFSSDMAYIESLDSKYFTGETLKEAYAATIIAGTTHEDKLSTKEYERGFDEYLHWINAGMPGNVPAYARAVATWGFYDNSPFCVTAHGLMCLAPEMIAPGDYIGILSGFKMPVAFRRVGSQVQQYYELLGPCYIHRMMRSRAWNLILEFKCKYRGASEDESKDESRTADHPRSWSDTESNFCEGFPFNAKTDYVDVLNVLGKRRIVLV